MVKKDVKKDICQLTKTKLAKKFLCAYYNIHMPLFVIEMSYVDYVSVVVDAGFLVEVIGLGLWGIYAS
jgi:hypothetical protein